MRFFSLLVSCPSVLAFPLSYTSTVTAKTYIPLTVVSISLFFLATVFFAIKLAYMKHRRIGTIHAPPSISTGSNLSSSTSSFGLRDKQGKRHRGLLVGCLGSPAWETNLTSRLDRAMWRHGQSRRSSFAHQLHTGSTICSTYTASAKSRSISSNSRRTKSTACTGCSNDADQLVLSLRSCPSTVHGGRAHCLARRNALTDGHPRYGDFGEFHGVRSSGGSIPKVARRASPSSIRLVDGPSHSSHVEYSFLSGLPPNAIVLSPLMGTRDSFQLSRCSLKCDRQLAPPLPPLPSFLPFYLPRVAETMESQPLRASEYLPPLRFSPLAGVAKIFYSEHFQQQVVERTASSRVTDIDESKNVVCSRIPCSKSTYSVSSKNQHANHAGLSTSSSVVEETLLVPCVRKTNMKLNHKRSQSCKGLAIGGSSPLLSNEVAVALSSFPAEDRRCSEVESMQTSVLRMPSGSFRSGGVILKKPLKSCLRQNSVMSARLVPSMSESNNRMHALGTGWFSGDQTSIQVPISDVDIGTLGLCRNDNRELKV